MPIRRFVLFTVLGSAAWNAVWIGIGWALGDQWEKAGEWGDYLQYAVLAAVVVGGVVLVVRQRRKTRSEVV
jgi:membrane protein DedA with SNARE-associated domain